MNNKRSVFAIVVLVLLGMTSCVVAGQLLLKRCWWWECAPTRTFDVSDLGLPASLFPDNAQYNPVYYDRNAPSDTVDNASQAIYWAQGGGAGYLAYQYPTTLGAQKNYARTRDWFFQNGNTKIPWDENVLTYKSSLADDFYSACGILVAKDYRCGMVAQYQEFYVFFNTTITKEITYEDFERAVVFIDQQMVKYLHGK
jgi:hypothetical protein